MAIISTYCKKGGVGKTTFIGYLAHYLTEVKNKTVLIISVDDQNSIFTLFGKQNLVTASNEDYLEHLMVGLRTYEEVLHEVRDNLYLIKTLNTDALSTKLIIDRSSEKTLLEIIDTYNEAFDYVLLDFPPSSCRATEVLLDHSDRIMLIISLDSLGIDGFINTIQFFVDQDIPISKIQYILPNKFVANRRAPKKSLETLQAQAKEFSKTMELDALILPYFSEKSTVQNIQEQGKTPFDKDELFPYRYDFNEMLKVRKELLGVFKAVDEYEEELANKAKKGKEKEKPEFQLKKKKK